jgi:hypothetical protein
MSFLKSFAKSVRSRSFLAMSSALVMVVGVLFGANIATADSVWVQSYGRTSQTEACVAQPGETPWQESWGANPSWSQSWEQWANNGKGGWTCTRSITWARDSAARVYNVGDIGPGGGTVFYVDMARAAGSQFWEVGSDLGTAAWCGALTSIPEALGTDIGTGEANTTAIMTNCVTPTGIAARIASAAAGGFSDWFLPSKDELNQLCKYARTQSTAVADQTVPCDTTGTLRSGFSGYTYWTSSQKYSNFAWYQSLFFGDMYWENKTETQSVRAVRAF